MFVKIECKAAIYFGVHIQAVIGILQPNAYLVENVMERVRYFHTPMQQSVYLKPDVSPA